MYFAGVLIFLNINFFFERDVFLLTAGFVKLKIWDICKYFFI